MRSPQVAQRGGLYNRGPPGGGEGLYNRTRISILPPPGERNCSRPRCFSRIVREAKLGEQAAEGFPDRISEGSPGVRGKLSSGAEVYPKSSVNIRPRSIPRKHVICCTPLPPPRPREGKGRAGQCILFGSSPPSVSSAQISYDFVPF